MLGRAPAEADEAAADEAAADEAAAAEAGVGAAQRVVEPAAWEDEEMAPWWSGGGWCGGRDGDGLR